MGDAMTGGSKKKLISAKHIGLFLLVLCMGQRVYGQDSSKTLVDDLVKHWQISKDLSLAVATAMPETAYSFKPLSADFGFADQLGNIVLVNVLSCNKALGTRAPERFQSAFDHP